MRLYHSPSSIALGARCQHAWALQYIDGIRDPDVTWVEIDAGLVEYTNRQRSTALGKAMHTVGQAWYTPGGTPDWHGLPGQIFLSGAHLLPHPDRCSYAAAEQPLGSDPMPEGAPDHAPDTRMQVHGVWFAGYKDLVVLPHVSEVARLGLPSGLVLIDYKSCASIARHALTPSGLHADVAANLYALDVCQREGLDRVAARWVYFESKRVRRAAPVDTVISRDEALAVLEGPAALARELDALTSSAEAPKNPLACADYGGCPHHKSAGGTCDARRSVGALIQARKKAKNMALPAHLQKKFEETQKALKTDVINAALAEAVEADASAAEHASGRPKVAKKAPKRKAAAPAPAPVATDTPARIILALHADLEQAQAELDEAEAARDTAAARVAGLLDSVREAIAS